MEESDSSLFPKCGLGDDLAVTAGGRRINGDGFSSAAAELERDVSSHGELREMLVALALVGPSDAAEAGAVRRREARLAVRAALGGDGRALLALAGRIPTSALRKAREAIVEAAERDVRVETVIDSTFPPRLRELADPPLALFVRGCALSSACCDGSGRERRMVAIVGTRRPPTGAASLAEKFARALSSHGACVVSGMAAGIDGAAHRGAIAGAAESRGSSGIAVLGSGVCQIYPAENRRLAEELLSAGGAIASEYPIDAAPRKHFFPERNRIVSALAEKVVVIEAGPRSGSLITARLALEQGRDVLAVPGDIWREGCQGSNALLRDGATPLFGVEQLLEELGIAGGRTKVEGVSAVPRTPPLPGGQREIVELCGARGALSMEELCEVTGRGVEELLPEIIALELKGFVTFDGAVVERAS